MKETFLIFKFKLKEIIKHDFNNLKVVLVIAIMQLLYLLKIFGFHYYTIKLLGFLFNSGWLLSDKIATRALLKYVYNNKLAKELKYLFSNHIDTIKPLKKTEKFFINPEKFFP